MNKNNQRSKQARAEARREQAKKRKTMRTIAWTGGSLLLVAGIITFLTLNQEPLPGEKITAMEDQSHIPEITSPHTPYNSDPPTSGPHVEYIANWGVHDEQVPFEVLVHNLEDGGVVIYYSEQADEAMVNGLKEIVGGYEEHVVLAPYPEMATRIALTAWGRLDRLETLDKERITKFIERYKGIDHH